MCARWWSGESGPAVCGIVLRDCRLITAEPCITNFWLCVVQNLVTVVADGSDGTEHLLPE